MLLVGRNCRIILFFINFSLKLFQKKGNIAIFFIFSTIIIFSINSKINQNNSGSHDEGKNLETEKQKLIPGHTLNWKSYCWTTHTMIHLLKYRMERNVTQERKERSKKSVLNGSRMFWIRSKFCQVADLTSAELYHLRFPPSQLGVGSHVPFPVTKLDAPKTSA